MWGFRHAPRDPFRELSREYDKHGPDRFSVLGRSDFELYVTPHEGQIEALPSRERPTYA